MSENVRNLVGPETIRRAEQTRWWTLAYAIRELLYNADVVFVKDKPETGLWETVRTLEETGKTADYSRRFAVTHTIWIRDDCAKVLPRALERSASGRVDVRVLLNVIAAECERAAVREVTP